MGLKIKSLESGGIRNLARYFLRSLTGHARLGSSEKNYFVSSTKLDVLTFGDFHNRESLVKENVITSSPGNIVEPKEAGKWQNTQGINVQFNRVIKFRMVIIIYHESHLNRSSTALDTKALLLQAEALLALEKAVGRWKNGVL